MVYTFDEYKKHLFDIGKDEEKHMAVYAEYMRENVGGSKYDYVSSIYVSDRYLSGRTINSNSHDRFSPPNYHTHTFFELIYIVEGEFINTVEGHEIIMKTGDVCLLPPHIYHSFDIVQSDFAKRLENYAINIFIKESSVSEYLSGLGNESFDNFLMNVKKKNNHRKFVLFSCRDNSICDNLVMLFHYNLHGFQKRLCDEKLDERVSISLIRAIMSEILSPSYKLSFSPSFTNNSSTGDIIKYISDNFGSVTLEKVAENFNYSFSYTSRLVKQRTGLCFSALLTEIRIEKASEMLRSTDMTIKEISNLCGYGSIEHFHRAFKKKTGTTPALYREKCN